MSEPVFASLTDLTSRMGEIDDVDAALAALEDASSLIHLVSERAWISDDGALDNPPGATKAICCAAARRVLQNPDGLTAESVANYSAQFSNATSDVYLTKSEIKRIRQACGKGGVTVISTTRGNLETPRVRDTDPDAVWIDEGL